MNRKKNHYRENETAASKSNALSPIQNAKKSLTTGALR